MQINTMKDLKIGKIEIERTPSVEFEDELWDQQKFFARIREFLIQANPALKDEVNTCEPNKLFKLDINEKGDRLAHLVVQQLDLELAKYIFTQWLVEKLFEEYNKLYNKNLGADRWAFEVFVYSANKANETFISASEN